MSQMPHPYSRPFGLDYSSEGAGTAVVAKFFNSVYAWMAAGLALTAVVAWYVSTQPELVQTTLGPMRFVFIIAELTTDKPFINLRLFAEQLCNALDRRGAALEDIQHPPERDDRPHKHQHVSIERNKVAHADAMMDDQPRGKNEASELEAHEGEP